MIAINDLPDVFSLLAANIRANGVRFAVKSMAENGDKKYRNEFAKVNEVVKNGGTLSSGIEKTSLFDSKTLAVIKANEEAGELESAFKELAKIAKFQRQSKRQIKKSLGMPAVGLVVLVGVVMFLAEGIFSQLAQRDQTGDTFLQVMGVLGAFVRDNRWAYVVGMGGFSFLLLKVINSRTVANAVSSIALQLPVFGGLLKMSQIGIWCRFAALMAKSGISVLETKKALESVLSERFREAIDSIFKDVSDGKDWSVATTSSRWAEDDARNELPTLFLSYVNSAGTSGVWEDKMVDAADTFFEEYENAVESTKPVVEALSIMLVMFPIGYIVFQLFSNLYGGTNAF